MMPITPALMQARRNANSIYTARLAEEKKSSDIEKKLKDRRTAEKEEMQNIAKLLEVREKCQRLFCILIK